jgi:hypothetical protein
MHFSRLNFFSYIRPKGPHQHAIAVAEKRITCRLHKARKDTSGRHQGTEEAPESALDVLGAHLGARTGPSSRCLWSRTGRLAS